MNVIEAPNREISLFLAGGISNCADWQSEVIAGLRKTEIMNDVTIYNPRRSSFDIEKDNPEEQIGWEYKYLNKVDIFTMYFAAGPSVQPICLYELGRYCEVMKGRFPRDWNNRIAITVNPDYKRRNDIIIQMRFCGINVRIGNEDSHIAHIIEKVKNVRL